MAQYYKVPNLVTITGLIRDPRGEDPHFLSVFGGVQMQVVTGRAVEFTQFEPLDSGRVRGRLVTKDTGSPVPGGKVVVAVVGANGDKEYFATTVDDQGAFLAVIGPGWRTATAHYLPPAGFGDQTSHEVAMPAPREPIRVTINQALDQTDPTRGDVVRFTVTFSEPVTGFDTSDIFLGGTAIPLWTTISGSGAVYTVSVGGMKKGGTVTMTVRPEAVKAIDGTLSAAPRILDNVVTYLLPSSHGDTTKPQITKKKGQTWINVYDVATGGFKYRVKPFKSSHGKVLARTADLDGDGNEELIVVEGRGGKGRFKVYDASGALLRSFRAAKGQIQGKPRLDLSDTNGDGFLDLTYQAPVKGKKRTKIFTDLI